MFPNCLRSNSQNRNNNNNKLTVEADGQHADQRTVAIMPRCPAMARATFMTGSRLLPFRFLFCRCTVAVRCPVDGICFANLFQLSEFFLLPGSSCLEPTPSFGPSFSAVTSFKSSPKIFLFFSSKTFSSVSMP